MKRSAVASSVLAIILPAILASCGGGGGGGAADKTPATPPAAPASAPAAPASAPVTPDKPLNVASNFTVGGSIASDKPYGGAVVNAYDAVGKLCSTTMADSKTAAYSLAGKCLFPIVISADLPDGNDVLPLPSGVKGEGRQWYVTIPEILKDGQSFTADVTPITTAATVLALGRLPTVTLPNTKSALTVQRLADGYAKIAEALQPFLLATGATAGDLTAAPQAGSPLAKLLLLVRPLTVRIDSTKQTIVKFQSATEHRPIVLVLTDGNPVTAAYIDSGLGMKVDDVSKDELKAGLTLLPELQEAMNTFAASPTSILDRACFLHNGLSTPEAIYDLPPTWTLGGSVVENPRILRINTYTNLSNETLEERNPGAAKLAFISFDFRDMRGLKRRGYTWLVKGDQKLHSGCSSAGPAWRVLGNQRPVYIRTWTYALHDVSFGNQFSNRQDTRGVGTEHFVGLPDGEGGRFTHVLVSGPGIPGDGKVFVNFTKSGHYLFSTMTLLGLRVAGNVINDPKSSDTVRAATLTNILNAVQDTRAILIPDADIKNEITDSFFDEQNTYTYRFFSDYADLAPSLTLQDVLPKRPYLLTEVPFDYFSSVGVNMDSLVRGLQSPEDITVNWNLPSDIRAKSMTPLAVFLQRISCKDSKVWPKCLKREQYIPEYDIDVRYPGATAQSVILRAPPPPVLFIESQPSVPQPTFMRQAKARVKVLDSLNRQIETAWSIDYQR